MKKSALRASLRNNLLGQSRSVFLVKKQKSAEKPIIEVKTKAIEKPETSKVVVNKSIFPFYLIITIIVITLIMLGYRFFLNTTAKVVDLDYLNLNVLPTSGIITHSLDNQLSLDRNMVIEASEGALLDWDNDSLLTECQNTKLKVKAKVPKNIFTCESEKIASPSAEKMTFYTKNFVMMITNQEPNDLCLELDNSCDHQLFYKNYQIYSLNDNFEEIAGLFDDKKNIWLSIKKHNQQVLSKEEEIFLIKFLDAIKNY